jgi:MFS family permease
VIAAISFSVHPSSARRAADALRRPWALQCSSPAWSHQSRNLLPKPLALRAALSQMDVPTRSSYVMAVVTPPERPAAASFTSAPRSLAASLSPALAGALFALSWPAAPLVVCGALKISYDLLLLREFRHLKPPEEI